MEQGVSARGLLISPLASEVRREEVLRNLGYPGSRAPSARVAEQLDALWSTALALLAPRGASRIVSAEEAAALGMPQPTPLVGLGLCTIGPALEEEEQRLLAAGQPLAALLLDAIGSAAAEATADALNQLLCQEAQRGGYQLPPRVSPGYAGWGLGVQPRLLALLGAEQLGIRLTEGLMMIPRKSVSFAVSFAQQPALTAGTSHHCAACPLEHCAYRAADRP